MGQTWSCKFSVESRGWELLCFLNTEKNSEPDRAIQEKGEHTITTNSFYKLLSIFIWAKNVFNHFKMKKSSKLDKNYDETTVEIRWLFKENRATWMCIVHSWQLRKLHFLPGLHEFLGLLWRTVWIFSQELLKFSLSEIPQVSISFHCNMEELQ